MITQGNPGYTLGFENLGYFWQIIFGRLFLYYTNINENTQGNPGLPLVIIEFWRHFQQNPWYFKLFSCLNIGTNINF